MPDISLIHKKLESMTVYLDEIKPILALPYKAFYQNYKEIRTAERDFQLLVDAAVDINVHLLLGKSLPPPETNYLSFMELGSVGVISDSFAKKIAPSAGLRNKLVHEYEDIHPQLLYRSLKRFVPLYKEYCKQVLQYIEKSDKRS